MERSEQEEIQCECNCDDNVAIFDQDNWQGVPLESQRQIEEKREWDPEMMKRIDEQLEYSQNNFFKVKVTLPIKTRSALTGIKSKKKIQSMVMQNNKTILKQGYVEKKIDGIFFSWHRRYLALTSEKLFIFESHKKDHIKGCINLKLLPTEVNNFSQFLLLNFNGQCENLILKWKTEAEKQQWRIWLEQVINYLQKETKVMLKTLMKPFYENKDSLTEREFIDTAETGDILLFFTENTGAKIQRFLTNSDYDHVAMVVKLQKRELMIFQSNANHGVSVYSWKQYIKYFDLYQRVAFRKLNYLRKQDLHQILMNFVKKNIGKKYDINAVKLLKLESDFNWENLNDDRGFFCSQLIAKALKSSGLLDPKKSSGRYWPVDFSEKEGMLLQKGAWLGREQIIILEKHIKNKL